MSEVSVLVLTEDGSKWAYPTVEHVCLQIFDWLVPQYQTGDWLTFAPVNDAAKKAMRANMWKSKKVSDQAKILRLCKNIAEHILRPDGFVFFHFDGDVIWGKGRSGNLVRFEEVIVARVREFVRGKVGDSARLDSVMTRLVHMSPHYSIETWLFANIAKLRLLGSTEAILDDWDGDATALDRTLRPKECLSIATSNYPALAQVLRKDQLYTLGTSFCAVVHRAGACGCLVVRLRAHWPDWVRSLYVH